MCFPDILAIMVKAHLVLGQRRHKRHARYRRGREGVRPRHRVRR